MTDPRSLIYPLPTAAHQFLPDPFGQRLAACVGDQVGVFALTPPQEVIWIQPQDQGLHYELVAFVGDRLLLYGYKSGASLPIPDGLIAYNIPTRKEAWRLPSAQLQAIHADSIQVALAIEGRTLIQHIRLSDGQPSSASPQTLHHTRTLKLPTLYQPKDRYFTDFEAFFAAYQKTICWGVEYLEWPEHMGISFYIAEGKTATHHFWCINDQKSVILRCVLRYNCPGLGQGSFGRVGEVLILPYQPSPDKHALQICPLRNISATS